MLVDLRRVGLLIATLSILLRHANSKPHLLADILAHRPEIWGPSFLEQPRINPASMANIHKGRAAADAGPPCTFRSLPGIALVLPDSLCSLSTNRTPGQPCTIQLKVTIPDVCKETGMLRNAPTVFFFSGFGVKTADYATLVHSFASWGYVIIQYEREVPSAAPPYDVETRYIGHLFDWFDKQRSNSSELLYGRLSDNITVAGHSMGGSLAAYAIGTYSDRIETAIFMDPVDFSFLDDRVSQKFLTKFGKPVLIFSVGIRCADRTKCMPPTASADATLKDPVPPCAPNWWCCDWDTNSPGPLSNMGLGAGLTTVHGGVNKFIAAATVGSWVVNIRQAGHMSFTDWDQKLEPDMAVQCPSGLPSGQILAIVTNVMLTWTQHRIRGLSVHEFLAWATSPALSAKSLALTII